MSRDENVIFKIMSYLFLNTDFVLKHIHINILSVTFKRLTRYKQKVVLAAMLEGKSMPSNMRAGNTNHTTLLKKIKVP